MERTPARRTTISDSYVVESEAVSLVQGFLPTSEWLWRQQSPDYFVDFVIEPIHAAEPSGYHFGLQIKGSRTLAIRKGAIRFRMERKPLLYCRDSAEFPIFVVVADIQQQRAYWLFAQRYLREQVGSARLDSQNTLTLAFLLENCLTDRARFERALNDAHIYMRDLYPGSVAAAARHRRDALQQLDPGVRVDVSLQKGVEVLHLHPTRPVSFTFGSRKEHAARGFELLNTHGEPFDSEMELVEAPDSKLFSELMPLGRYRVVLEPPSRDGTVQLSWQSTERELLQLEGTWRGGTHAAQFAGFLPRAPLGVELSIERGESDDDIRIGVATPLRLNLWVGQIVSELAWFPQIHSFFAALCSGADVAVTYFCQGEKVGHGLLASTTEAGSKTLGFLDWLHRVRWLAQHYNARLAMPPLASITYDSERQVHALWALTTGAAFVEEMPEATFSFSAEGGAILPARWSEPATELVGSVSISGGSTFNLLGHPIELSDVENIFTAVQIASIEHMSDSSRRITFRGRDNARWVRRRMTNRAE
jgi:hypothetical protein